MPLVALLDSNVWVSAFLKPTGPPGKVVGYWQNEDFRVVTSLSQLSELIEVLGRPRLSRRFRYTAEEAEYLSGLSQLEQMWCRPSAD